MKTNTLITVVLLLLPIAALHAQPAERPVQILVAPDRADFLYKEGETVKFEVSVLKNGIPVKDISIRYEISEDMMKPHKTDGQILKNGTGSIKAGSMKKPGFLRCRVYTDYNGKSYQGMAAVGFSPHRLEPVTKLPQDFVKFWDDAKAKAARLPMDVKMTLVPERCTEKINVYHVSLQNYEAGSRIYGILCIPKAEGKYPAILKVPGAGIRAYNGDIDKASKGYIVFEIGIHGIPVNLPGEVYRDLSAGPLKNYHSFNLDNRDTYYYKRVYLGCVRAIDFIHSLPQYDGDNLISYGGSQGGALAIVTAALDNRVKGLVSFYPALCDMAGYLQDRAGGWPHIFTRAENNTPAKIATAQYYDVVNFARQLQVPGFYTFGYNDMVCPPTTVYSAINTITSPKEIYIMENTAHYAYPEQREETWKWVERFFNSKQ